MQQGRQRRCAIRIQLVQNRRALLRGALLHSEGAFCPRLFPLRAADRPDQRVIFQPVDALPRQAGIIRLQPREHILRLHASGRRIQRREQRVDHALLQNIPIPGEIRRDLRPLQNGFEHGAIRGVVRAGHGDVAPARALLDELQDLPGDRAALLGASAAAQKGHGILRCVPRVHGAAEQLGAQTRQRRRLLTRRKLPRFDRDLLLRGNRAEGGGRLTRGGVLLRVPVQPVAEQRNGQPCPAVEQLGEDIALDAVKIREAVDPEFPVAQVVAVLERVQKTRQA